MARKFDLISQLYVDTSKEVLSPDKWAAFLRTACYNYRLRFDEQLLIYAQKPEATAVLPIERWNRTFGRWVNRGAKGIAVFERHDGVSQKLVHYFDISDTHAGEYSRAVPIWTMQPEYTDDVIATLESNFGDLEDKDSLAKAIMSAANNAVEDNTPDYIRDLLLGTNDSFLEGLGEDSVTVMYKELVTNSVAYMLMTRLGIDTEMYFDDDDFRNVVNFNSDDTLNALGVATSAIAEMGLSEVSKTVLALNRQNRTFAENRQPEYTNDRNNERSFEDGRTDLHNAGRLSAFLTKDIYAETVDGLIDNLDKIIENPIFFDLDLQYKDFIINSKWTIYAHLKFMYDQFPLWYDKPLEASDSGFIKDTVIKEMKQIQDRLMSIEKKYIEVESVQPCEFKPLFKL